MIKHATVLKLCLFVMLALAPVLGQGGFERLATFQPNPDLEVGGYGNIVAGVDLDNDGNSEVYFVNNDWEDLIGGDLVPRIYKYEDDGQGNWVLVWWTRLDLNFQNTWPTLSAADLDNDGKGEIVWGPVNNTGGGTQPNPARIVVFETVGDGSDNMGIATSDTTAIPNSSWTITGLDNANIRPFRWEITDIDGDGTDEIVTALRAGDERAAIYSVDDIPDAGLGTETWTLEWEGLGAATNYDLAVVGGNAYFISSAGDVTRVRWNGSAYEAGTTQVGLVPGGSWKTAAVVDVDGDTNEEIMVAGWLDDTDKRVWLLQEQGDTLVASQIGDLSAYDGFLRINGASAGDVDGDGNVDYIMGTRDVDPAPGAINNVMRLEYQGGDITNMASYEVSVVDSNVIAPQGAQIDVVVVANIDGDPEDEILYAGVLRGGSGPPPVLPVVVLNWDITIGGIDDQGNGIAKGFILRQNFPNPFNPETKIQFELPIATDVSITLYNMVGQEVVTLVNETRASGLHTVTWDGTNSNGVKVASGVYVYQMRAGKYVQNKKMTLVK